MCPNVLAPNQPQPVPMFPRMPMITRALWLAGLNQRTPMVKVAQTSTITAPVSFGSHAQ